MVLGSYREALSARSTEKRIQDVSQDGGIVSSLLCYALDEGIIEGAVVAGDPGDDWTPVPQVVTSSDEVIDAAGTKYSMSPNIFALKEAVRQYGLESVAIVATPCQVQGIRKAQAYPFSTRFVTDKIKLIIGIYCMENFPMASLNTFAEAKLNTTLANADKMDIGKGKFWLNENGEEKGLALKETHGYEQAGCNVCQDYVCEYSDISTGSVGSPDGWSTVLTRTDAGEDIFKAAIDADLIETKEMDDVKPGLGLLEKLAKDKKEKSTAECERRAKMGVRIPTIY